MMFILLYFFYFLLVNLRLQYKHQRGEIVKRYGLICPCLIASLNSNN